MIYLDNAATTRVCKPAIDACVDAMNIQFGNPSSLHGLGIEAERLVKKAREEVANALGANTGEVYFTSGGTEGNNIAVFGTAYANSRKGKHIITTQIEHASVLEPIKNLDNEGFEVTYIKPDENGVVSAQAIADAVKENTILVSVMSVNNEVGSVQPIGDICRLVKKKKTDVIVHTDGVQAFFKQKGKLCESGADIITVSGHKINAPKGIGAIYIKKGVKTTPRVRGGGQENGLRSGTEAVHNISAFGAACREWSENVTVWRESMQQAISAIYDGLAGVDGVYFPTKKNGGNILSVSVTKYPSEVVMRMLEQRGIYVSSGSACSKGKRSYVLRAMGVKDKMIDSAIRVSAGNQTKLEDAEAFVCAVKEILLRG